MGLPVVLIPVFVAIVLALTPFVARGQAGDQRTPLEQPYQIGPEDVLQVQVWGRPELTGPAEVGVNGDLQLPVVGRITAQGKTPEDLSSDLSVKYRLFDSGISEVIVTILQYNSKRISVVGEVRSPGKYGFREIPDLWAVLLAAGGATPQADLSKVQVVHKDPRPGEVRSETVDISHGIDKTAVNTLPVLRTQDTVLIPSLGVDGAKGDKIYVLGAVRAPGSYGLSGSDTVIKAIAASGGALPNANLKEVRLTRPTPGGAISYQLNVYGYLYGAQPQADLSLKSGDTLTIPEGKSLFGRAFDSIPRILPVVTVAISIVALNR